jgi:hypothetical protein
LRAPSLEGDVLLSAVTYNDGALTEFEASTVCNNGTCEQYNQSGKHITLVVAPPAGRLPMTRSTLGPVPVLLRVVSPDTNAGPARTKEQMATEIEAFLANADLPAITAPYGHRQ